jgi:hypothetical protein
MSGFRQARKRHGLAAGNHDPLAFRVRGRRFGTAYGAEPGSQGTNRLGSSAFRRRFNNLRGSSGRFRFSFDGFGANSSWNGFSTGRFGGDSFGTRSNGT